MTRLAATLAVALAATTALAGCGTTEEAEPESAGSTTQQVSLTDARGKTVTLDGPAKRVVTTEWGDTETLVSLGVQPVGAADIKNYRLYDVAAPLASSVTDIGVRGEPSVDTVASLEPDLVLASSDLSSSAIKQLERVAPVLVVKSADASRPLAQMTDNVRLIAEATGTQDAAAANLSKFRSTLAAGKAELADADLDGTAFAFADGYQEGNQVTIRPYTSGSLVGAVSAQLGLASAWTVKGDKAYGLASTDVEGLTKLPDDVRFGYISNAADGGDPFAGGLKDNAVWKSLPMVGSDHVYKLPDGIWMFGTTASMTRYVDALVDALTS